jgi:hypothetical protein
VKRTLPSLAAIILAVLAIRVPLLGIPFDRDEGGYAYIAWRMGFHELPYRDWIDQKPPGVFWIYRLGLDLPVDAISAIHLMALLFAAASACALFFLASRFTKPFWALAAALLFVILSADPRIEGTSANTELFMLLPLILSQMALLSPAGETRRGIGPALEAGALTGIAVAFKQVAIVNWPFLVFTGWVFAAGPERGRRTWSLAAWSALGGAAVWGVIGTYFLVHHELGGLVYNVFSHNVGYVETLAWPDRFKACAVTLARLSQSQAPVWVFSVAGLASLWISRKSKQFLHLGAWLLSSIAGAGISGYFFPHYFQQLLPALCLAAVKGAEALEGAEFWKPVPARGRRGILCTILGAPPCILIAPFLFTYSPRDAIRRIYPGNSLFAEMPEIGKRIAELTRPADRVFVFGADPEALFYARRESATRYIFLLPLYGAYADAHELQLKTSEEVAASRPAAALYLPDAMFFDAGNDQYFTGWSKEYLRRNFHVDSYLPMDVGGISSVIPVTSKELGAVARTVPFYGALFVRNPEP